MVGLPIRFNRLRVGFVVLGQAETKVDSLGDSKMIRNGVETKHFEFGSGVPDAYQGSPMHIRGFEFAGLETRR